MVHNASARAELDVGAVPFPALVAFESVARHLNFSRAASELEVSPTAISKSIRQLETRLGLRLFQRTTRSVALTEAGSRLLENLSPAIEQIRQSVATVSDAYARPFGALRINTSYVAYASLIAPRLPQFLARFPDIRFEASLDNRLSDIVAAGFDAGIRLGHALHQDVVAVPIGPRQRRVVVAAPDYWSRHGEPRKPEDLLAHDCIRQRLHGGARFFDWAFQVNRRSVSVDVQGRLVFDEMRSVLDAAQRGCGVGYVFEQFAERALASRELAPVLEKFSPATEAFHLYYPSRGMMPGKLRAFIDFLAEYPSR